MGGAGYIFTGDNDAAVMHNSATINLNMAELSHQMGVKKIFYSSSACMYPAYNQEDPDNPKCNEDSAYPAAPDSEYGWEKLFSERLYFAPIIAITNYRFALLDFIIFMAQRVLIGEARRKPQQRSVAKWLNLKMVALLRFGEMVNRPGHFCTSMIALMRFGC